MTHPDAWDPERYHRFQEQRSQPFHDLLALVPPRPERRIVDLGCGTGELTAHLHRALGARSTLGVDTSARMLEQAAEHAGEGLAFRRARLEEFTDEAGFDLVFSNAALQWADDHPRLLAHVARLVAPGGTLAVQVPANHDHVSHTLAHELAAEEPYSAALEGWTRSSPVLTPEDYAATLHRLGFRPPDVRLIVYPHELESRTDVVRWVGGTLLTAYERRLPSELHARFVAEFEARLLPRLDDTRPYFYPFKRILMVGTRA